MSNKIRINILLTLIAILPLSVIAQSANQREGGSGYREAADAVIKRLQLKADSVVVDIGAGDGWWSAKIAEQLGSNGTVHAAEINQRKVDTLKTKWADIPQIKPYLCPMDGTDLEPDTCDMAFISKTYHHFDKDVQVDYLKHLGQVIKPSGKLVIIEPHPGLASGRGKEHTWPPGLLAKQAEDAGWMLLKCNLIPRSDHYMAIFVQSESFAEKFKKRKNNSITAQEEEYSRIQKTPREPDVVYVPTPQHVVEKMLEMAHVTKDDLLYDLGCGDGRIVVTAAKKYGCRAVGYDIARRRVKKSLENVQKNDIEHLVSIEQKDIFTLDLSKANVVTLYLLPELNVKLIPQLEKLKPGSRIVSHDFDMEGVKPDKVITIEDEDDEYGDHTVYLWTTPLKKEQSVMKELSGES